MTGDPTQVSQALKKWPENINDTVRAKAGARAGFTPLILAAALSHSEIAEMLIGHGAEITRLDDYNRSAFWYAALLEDIRVTKVLIGAPAVHEVVNAAEPLAKFSERGEFLRSTQGWLAEAQVSACLNFVTRSI
jgi:ankyrin repeat protein